MKEIYDAFNKLLDEYKVDTTSMPTYQYYKSEHPDISSTLSTLKSTENNDFLNLELLVPGYKDNEIEIYISNNMLNIEGKKTEKTDSSFVKEKFKEIKYIDVEKLDTTNISAKLENGILSIKIPKKEIKNEKIKIQIK